jgi:hypothetical protein
MVEQRVVVALDAVNGVEDVVGIGGDIAEVVDPQTVERRSAGSHVVRPQQYRFAADAARAETCPGSIRGADVEWHTDNRCIEFFGLAPSGQAHERRDPTEARHLVAPERLRKRGRRHERNGIA